MAIKKNPQRTLLQKVWTAGTHPLDTLRKRAARRRAAPLRQHYLTLVEGLPPVVTSKSPRIEVHMLCGAKTWDMGVWASWSLLRFLTGARLYVHSDGTLTPNQIERWERVVPDTLFIDRQVADEHVQAVMGSDYPHLLEWRSGYWAAPQLVDMHLFGESPLLICMDSDVLCFRRPTAIERLIERSAPCFRYNLDTDGWSAYIGTPEDLERHAGAPVPRAVNAGFSLTRRLGVPDFAKLNDLLPRLRQDPRLRFGGSFQSNSLYALAHAGHDAAPLPGDYDVYHGRGHEGRTVRHYVTRVETRSRFFTEGLPDLWRQANANATTAERTVALTPQPA